MERSDPVAKSASQGPGARLETDLQADPGLREGPVSRGRLTFVVIALIVVLVWVGWALFRAQ